MAGEHSSNPDSLHTVQRRESLPCTVEELFEAFGNPVRRWTLSHLHSTPRKAVSTDELAERCAEAENTADDPERLAFALHHTHLPKLDDVGFLDYDPDAGTVRGPDADVVEASVDELRSCLSEVVEE
ncbi:DUF7344 domain-containing protein [Haloprofundus halobius]|uniref:DUF7344 domain-containing protein n=1 Tax=Haloprofundus halobius TaxID=2876194 RepID=UPI001CD00A02|nr:hypothetical protein [Haloprofundus halobius]